MTSRAIARRAEEWRPPWEAVERGLYHSPEVGMVVAYQWAAWEVTHVSPMAEPDDRGHDTRATLHRLHGPKHERENSSADLAVSYTAARTQIQVYRGGRVYLCSCCSDPAPCRMQVAEEAAAQAAALFEERLKKMGPGICYSCGEIITARQDSIRFPGDHADFPGRPGPRFHTRGKCRSELRGYDPETGQPTDHGDGNR